MWWDQYDRARFKRELESKGFAHGAIQKRMSGYGNPHGLLDLSDLGLERISESLPSYPGVIRVLDLRRNKLKELPSTMSGLESLQRLVLSSNRWSALPEVIFDIPQLSRVDGAPGFGRNPGKARLNDFLTRTRGVDGERRRRLWRVASEGTADMPLSRLFEALRGNYPELYAASLKALLSRSQGAPLDDEAVVAVIGDLSVKRAALKAALKARGVRYTRGLSRATTHVVLGRSPKNVEGHDHRQFTFVTEAEAVEVVRAHVADTRPLLGGTRVMDEAHARNLSTMLLSDHEDTIELAMGMIDAHGMAPGAFTAMFIVAKLGVDATQRASARRLLKRHAPPHIMDVLARSKEIGRSGAHSVREIASALDRCAQQAPELDWGAVARRLSGVPGSSRVVGGPAGLTSRCVG